MQKVLITLICGASLAATGCSATRDTLGNIGAAIPNALAKTPLMYRPDVQQGNVIEQEAVNQLRPGMTRSQVRYLLGTPMVDDVFHRNRWDYVYTLKKGGGGKEEERLTVYFENERLTRIEGDYRPAPEAEGAEEDEERVVSVPDYDGEKKGLITRALQKVGLNKDDAAREPEEAATEAEEPAELEEEGAGSEEPGFFSRTLQKIGLGGKKEPDEGGEAAGTE